MAVDIVTRAENGAPLSIERLDLNFSNTRTALDDLYVKFAAGIRIVGLSATEDGLVMTMSDDSTLGPIPFPIAAGRLRGPWMAGGAAYQLRDQVYVDGVGSAVATMDHESGADFQTDLDLGRWQMIASNGTDGEDASGGSGGGGKVLLSAHIPGPLASGDTRVLMIPVDAAGLGEGVDWHIKVLTAPGAGESLDWKIEHVGDPGNLQLTGTISGTETSAATYIEPFTEFVGGDMLAISITSTSAGCAAADLVVGIALGEVVPAA